MPNEADRLEGAALPDLPIDQGVVDGGVELLVAGPLGTDEDEVDLAYADGPEHVCRAGEVAPVDGDCALGRSRVARHVREELDAAGIGIVVAANDKRNWLPLAS